MRGRGSRVIVEGNGFDGSGESERDPGGTVHSTLPKQGPSVPTLVRRPDGDGDGVLVAVVGLLADAAVDTHPALRVAAEVGALLIAMAARLDGQGVLGLLGGWGGGLALVIGRYRVAGAHGLKVTVRVNETTRHGHWRIVMGVSLGRRGLGLALGSPDADRR